MKKQAACCNRCQLIQVVARDKHGLTLLPIQSTDKAHILSMPNGSNPFAGSSKISTSVSPNKAVAISSRRFIPREKLLTLFFSSTSSPTRPKTRGTSRFSSSPHSAHRIRRFSAALRDWYAPQDLAHSDTRPHQAQLFFRLASKELHAPRRWLTEAQYDFNKRAFARPVCTNKAQSSD